MQFIAADAISSFSYTTVIITGEQLASIVTWYAPFSLNLNEVKATKQITHLSCRFNGGVHAELVSLRSARRNVRGKFMFP